MKRKKINDRKFIRNIIIGIASLLIAAFIINVAPGYKRDKYKDVINLIINEENKTEILKYKIYVNENETVYISQEDVKNLFDNNIYYDSKYNQIITTSDTKVANITIDEKKMTVNNSNVSMLDSIIKINNNIYLPISDMEIVYNIDVKYIPETNRVIIDELDKGMIRAVISEDTDIKYKPRGLSKDIGTLKKGETVNCFYTTSKGWRHIRTSSGIIGYIKANKLSNEYIIRQDMLERGEANSISRNEYLNKSFVIQGNNITIKNIFNMNQNINIQDEQNNEAYKVWTIISNEAIESEGNKILDTIFIDYKARTTFIDLIVKKVIGNNISGVVIDFNGIENKDSLKRFVIEIAPKLREIGITTSIVLNEGIEKQDYINIVDYIVE
ncbi:MAG: hypothetical protein IJE59_00800 [Clostridia bacterium]|nr:hypothetical protein [Clostridia bacterium]